MMKTKREIDISIILCTHNRAELLGPCLELLLGQKGHSSYEIIVVDNASTDNTAEVIRDFFKSDPQGRLVHEFEPEIGKSYALNRALKLARGGILLFTDDDVLVGTDWVNNMADAFKANDADGVGGKILPEWKTERPEWFSRALYPNLALIDYGDDTFVINNDRPYYGANMAFRRLVFEKIGNFKTHLGRKGKLLLGNEDTELCKRAMKAGFRLIYNPNACVHHIIQDDRMTKKYFCDYYFGVGESMILSGKDEGGSYRCLLGMPLWRLRGYLNAFVSLLMGAVTFKSSRIFMNRLKLMEAAGYAHGLLKYSHSLRQTAKVSGR